ncbi:oligogalacturonate-specific porin KdgM family protein [Escherichia coli]
MRDLILQLSKSSIYSTKPMRVNDFNSSNGKDHHWEITNTFRYRINEHWLPYFELRWLDRNVEPYHREQNQIRIGTKYFF